MNNIEILTDRIAATILERRRNREMQRQDRIFNAKVRTIGIDKEALDFQVNERKQKEAKDAESQKACAEDAVLDDKAACLLDQRQRQGERLRQKAIDDFRLNFQPRRSRREYDLSNPDGIRNQEGIRMLPGLVGEDPDSQGRLKRQQEQLREWSIQQQQELATARHRKRLEEQQYDQNRVDLDNKALQLQKMDEERMRAVALATKDFNRAKAAEDAEKRRKQWQQEQEDNGTDILNQLQGELLTESLEQGTRGLGQPRLRADRHQGLVNRQLQQMEENNRIQEEREQEEHRQEECRQEECALRMSSARTALLLERQQAHINKQLRRTLDHTNARLAEARQQQKKRLEEEYTNIPDERYFSQFNTSSR